MRGLADADTAQADLPRLFKDPGGFVEKDADAKDNDEKTDQNKGQFVCRLVQAFGGH
jgi:hypothetical protein